MQVMEKNSLFSEVTEQEAATVSGGLAVSAFALDSYLFALGAGTQFGNPGLTPDEIQFAWESAVLSSELIPPVIALGGLIGDIQ